MYKSGDFFVTNMIKIRNYKILDLLGYGGTSEVYLAINSSGEKRAIKVLRGALSENHDAVSRFFREYELAGLCKDSRLVRIDEACTSDDGRPVLIMEFLEGTTLANFKKEIPAEEIALCQPTFG